MRNYQPFQMNAYQSSNYNPQFTTQRNNNPLLYTPVNSSLLNSNFGQQEKVIVDNQIRGTNNLQLSFKQNKNREANKRSFRKPINFSKYSK